MGAVGIVVLPAVVVILVIVVGAATNRVSLLVAREHDREHEHHPRPEHSRR